jgi:prepilin-type N-terminal cleavage/methylation domain-containing protein
MTKHRPPSPTKNFSAGRRRHFGFSLAEVMTVMALISLLSVTVGPNIGKLAMGGSFQRALIDTSGAFEKAREYAVASNGYVYVGFTKPDTKGEIYGAIFAAKDGSTGGVSDLTSGRSHRVEATGNESLALLDRVFKLEGCALADSLPANNALNGNPALEDAASSLSSGDRFECDAGAAGSLTFERVIQFTPQGEGRVARTLSQTVQAVLVPLKGDPAKQLADSVGASVIRVAALTGRINVYRP